MPNITYRRTILVCAPWAAGLAAASLTTVAHAHVGAEAGLGHTHDTFSSLLAGAAHPLTGLDHVAAMVSVGLWSALSFSKQASSPMGAARILSAPLVFAATLLMGALMALNGVTLPGVEPMIAASLLAMGLLVATRSALPTGMGAALVVGFALFHGLAHGQELGGHAAAALTGMVLSTLALHAVGIAAGLALRQRSRWLPRIAGIGVATLGLGLLTPAIAGAF
ncbi:HupE/UreJ family protein [Aquabacterium sp.]|uniref:HupE/UreJ family protein n=1 Tax=Aquabacterium sp. TaxID=1872578 RepID=UPI002489421D|nr:HupE/UreJ family protein [Aquabacterium sp.]MDI1261453.1 HupE/UreJ family protein [Aquabacterium sp.]